MLIDGAFESRVLANMNAALDRVCEQAARGQEHSVRKRVANEIIKCARSGKTALDDLMEAGRRGLAKTKPQRSKSVRLRSRPRRPNPKN